VVGRNVTPRDDTEQVPTADDQGFCTRGVVFTLDPTLAQERLLRSYAGAARVAYNWAIARVSENLATHRPSVSEGSVKLN